MENAADALKIAFAVFIFVIALTITFSLVAQAKSTADVVLYYSDETNFYDYYTNFSDKNRLVSVSDIISTLHRYDKESLCVMVDLKDRNSPYKFELSKSNNFADTEAIEKDLGNFINNKLLKDYSDKTFKEEFVEVPISGRYQIGEDDTKIVEASGGEKVYITYILENN